MYMYIQYQAHVSIYQVCGLRAVVSNCHLDGIS